MDNKTDILLVFVDQDNQSDDKGFKGWVTNFHKFLTTLLSQITKGHPEVQLVKASDLTGSLLDNACAVMPIVSESIVNDQSLKTITEWAKGLQKDKSLKVGDVPRLMMVVKNQIDVEVVFPDFVDLISYDFFYVDPQTGISDEYRRFFGGETEQGFWMKLVDIAYDISHILDEDSQKSAKKKKTKVDRNKTVYLASTGMDLLTQRDVLKRELKSHGYEVLPNRSLPKDLDELEKSIKEDLANSRMSIHLIGEDYGYKPAGSDKSIVDIQNLIAQDHTLDMSEYNKKNGNDMPFSRLVWLSPDLLNVSERQKIFIEDIKGGAAMVEEAEVLQIQLQELKSIIREELLTGGRFHVKRDVKGYDDKDEEGVKVIYLIADQMDLDSANDIDDFLSKQGFKVLRPNYEGELVDIRYVHHENLRRCDGSIIYYGKATHEWIKTKQFDLMKAPGFGREKPLRAKAVYIEGEKEVNTEEFEKNKTIVLGNAGKFKPDQLKPFLSKLTD